MRGGKCSEQQNSRPVTNHLGPERVLNGIRAIVQARKPTQNAPLWLSHPRQRKNNVPRYRSLHIPLKSGKIAKSAMLNSSFTQEAWNGLAESLCCCWRSPKPKWTPLKPSHAGHTSTAATHGSHLHGHTCGSHLHGRTCGSHLHGHICGSHLHGRILRVTLTWAPHVGHTSMGAPVGHTSTGPDCQTMATSHPP